MLRVEAAGGACELADRLAEVLSDPLDDPMAAEWVVVTTGGAQRWLRLELSRSLGTSGDGRVDGVAANIDTFFPGQLTRRILHPATDHKTDPWELERVAWVVLDILARSGGSGDLGPLERLAPGVTQWGRARRIADLFDKYLTHRPEMIRAWAEGNALDGVGQGIADRSAWQPRLWRLVRERIGEPSPPELLPDRLAALRGGDCPVEVPARVSLFGLTTIPGGGPFLDLLEALGTQREVHLLLQQPSAVMSASTLDAVAQLGDRALYRSDDPTVAAARHPLLRSWGRPAREAVVLLGDRFAPQPTSGSSTPESAPRSLLERIQHDVRLDRPPAGDFVPADDDESVRVHSCHGSTRQVEVLRDQILHCLADDPTLTEQDVVVFCPLLEEFAPLIESVLGPPAGLESGVVGGAPKLNYRLTDRSLGSSYPLLGALGALVELLASRFSDAAVLEFANLGPVRERFELTDEDLTVLAEWVQAANTRWGLDGQHRGRWGIPPDYVAGSWRRALDRILMGVAVSADASALAPGDIQPIPVEGSRVGLAGRLADLLGRLAALAEQSGESRPALDWVALLQQASQEMFEVDPTREWQRHRLDGVLETIADQATLADGACAVDLDLADIRHLIGRQLGAAAGRSDFFRGGITISSLTPLRGLPYRVVCLLGMDEVAFTTGSPDGDDLSTAKPHIGDRDRRSDTRQMLLDSLLSAQDRLVLIRTGHSVVTNQIVPPAVVVAELRDAIGATVESSSRKAVLERLSIVHPRQSFDEQNFLGEDSPCSTAGRVGPWSFDPLARAGAEARNTLSETAAFLPEPLEVRHEAVVDLADLRDFIVHPPRFFLRRSMEVSLPRRPSRGDGQLVAPTAGSSGLPRPAQGRDLLLDLNALERWHVNDRLLEHLRQGGDPESFLRREHAGDFLPPGRLADVALADAAEAVEPLIDALGSLGVLGNPVIHRSVDIALPDGTRVVGVVRDDGGDRPGPVEATVSGKKDTQPLMPWIDVVALTAADADTPWRAVMLNPADNAEGCSARGLEVVGDDAQARRSLALETLAFAVDLFRRGCREPLPLFPRLSWALYKRNSARNAWGPNPFAKCDSDDEWIQMAFDHATVEDITSLAVRHDDPSGESSDRSTRYARHLWGKLEGSAPVSKIKLAP